MKSRGIIKACHWEITKRCNLSCLHCISSIGSRRELDKKSALKVIDILKNLGCKEIYFTGGEPLVRQDIFSILRKVKENKMKVGLLSNGTLINSSNIKQIKNYVDEIGISLDGASPQINDKIRGKGTFQKILKAVSVIKKNKIPLTLYITINKINLDDFENILKLTTILGADNIRVNEVSLRGRAFQNRRYLKIPFQHTVSLKESLLKGLEKKFSQEKRKRFLI